MPLDELFSPDGSETGYGFRVDEVSRNIPGSKQGEYPLTEDKKSEYGNVIYDQQPSTFKGRHMIVVEEEDTPVPILGGNEERFRKLQVNSSDVQSR